MKNSFFQEIFVSSVLIILLILILDPFGFQPNVKMIAIIFIIVFSAFASFIWKESVKDEREAFHRKVADRIAFLTGSGMLVIGIIIQYLKGSVDFWLVLTLSMMIFAKALGLIYSRIKH